MNPTNPTPGTSSIISGSAVTFQPPPSHRILEICLISARDLSPVSKPLRTYALVWIHPNRKRSTSIDQHGNANPAWNDKFCFRINDDFLASDSSAVNVEIYTSSWFRDVLVGTVRVTMNNLITPLAVNRQRFVALQVRRQSGNHQGILNMAVSLIDHGVTVKGKQHNYSNHASGDILDITMMGKMMSVPECDDNEDEDEEKLKLNAKIQQWRAMSEDLSDIGPGSLYNGSMVNGSVVNGGSEICSDIGPSASIVAAEILRKSELSPVQQPKEELPARRGRRRRGNDGAESLILEDMTAEEAAAKGLSTTKWRAESHGGAVKSQAKKGNGGQEKDGAVKCFANAYGIQFTIVCGSGHSNGNGSRVCKPSKYKKKMDQ